MAKFALECPKCGSLNTASTFILAKKTIQCGSCGEEIHVQQARLTSKQCPECGKVVVCDQAKLDKKKCPSCGASFSVASATATYKMTKIVCPQCTCQIEVDKTKEYAFCPVCDKKVDIKETLAKANLVSDTGISVIQYEGDNDTFVWKHPVENFNLGSQLIVHESQEAVFFLNGQALDLFGPGRHTLETENLPVLKKIYDLPTNQQNPFHAEVYFINKTVQMGIKWGTDSRVRFIEPNTQMALDIGASGEMSLQVNDSRKMLVKLIGTTRGIAWESDNNEFTKSLRDAFRPFVMTTVKSNLAATIKTENINILEIDEKLEALSLALRAKVSAGFEEYGLFVPQFYVTNVSLPEEDPNFKKIRELLAVSYLGVKEAEVEAKIAAAKRKVVLEEETTKTEVAKKKAEQKEIEAKGEANAHLVGGLTDAKIMNAQGYNQKDVLQADVQKAYAGGIGQMGSNAGGSGGSIMSDTLGVGVGLAVMGAMGEKVGEAMKGFNGTEPTTVQPMVVPAKESWTCSCGCDSNTGKFCYECGAAKPEAWECPNCGVKDNKGKFCYECGAAKPELWVCPQCGEKGNKGKFCAECGAKKEEN